MKHKTAKSLSATLEEDEVGMTLMVDSAGGYCIKRVPWEFDRLGKKKMRAAGKGVILLFQATPEGRIWVSFVSESVGTESAFQFAVRLLPSELKDVVSMFSGVSRHASEMIRLSKRRGYEHFA